MKRVGMIFCVLLLVGVAGCGGSGGSDTTVSKAEFVKQAEAICSEAAKAKEAELKAALKAYEESGRKTKAQETQLLTAMVTDAVLPPLSKMSEELGQLGTPDTNADEAREIVEAFEAATAEIEERPTAAAKGTFDPFEESAALSSKYGLKACSDF